MRPRLGALVVAVAFAGLAGCSDAGSSTGDTTVGSGTDGPAVTICDPGSNPQSDDELPRVALIADAVTALEDELGAPAEYFEINATARVVNLFVALNDGSMVQPWVYLDGELSSEDPRPAGGGTFRAEQLAFDEEAVLEQVRTEIPDAILESFYVHGDGEGAVQYGVLASAVCGGGLDILVGADGAVLSVDPV